MLLDVLGQSPRAAGSRYALTVTDSSVGPYRFSTVLAGAASAQVAALSRVNCSPANRLQRRAGMPPGGRLMVSLASEMMDGTEYQCVTPLALTNEDGSNTSQRTACQRGSATPGDEHVEDRRIERQVEGL